MRGTYCGRKSSTVLVKYLKDNEEANIYIYVLFSVVRMQRCKQSRLLPAGAEVQVLQPCILQTDVLQDLPGALTLEAEE